MKTYPRWKIQKFVPVPGRLYRTLGKGTLWELLYILDADAEPHVSLRRPTFDEVRDACVAIGTSDRKTVTR